MWRNKKVRGVAQLLISVALLTWLIRRVGPAEVANNLANLNWNWYVPALLLFILNIVIRAYRWLILFHSLNDRPTLGELVYLYFIGFFANNFIPSGFGGDIVKVVSLRQQYGRGAEALSSVVMDRVTGLLGSALIALIALIWNRISHTVNVDLPRVLWFAIEFLSVGLPLGFLFVRYVPFLRWLENQLPQAKKLPAYDKLLQLVDTVRRYPLAALLRALLISLPFTLSLVFVQYSIARALAVDVPLAVFSLFVPLIAIINLLPFSFNGLGVREGVYIFLFTPIGVTSQEAVAMSLAFYLLRVSAGLLGGLLLALRNVRQMLRTPQAENL